MANDMDSYDELPSVENVQLVARRPQRVSVTVIPDRVDVACENWQLACRRTSTRVLLRVTEVELVEQRTTRSVKRSTDGRELHDVSDRRRRRESVDESGAAESVSTSVTVSETSTSVIEDRSSSSERTSAYCSADNEDTSLRRFGSTETEARLVSSMSDSSADNRVSNIGAAEGAEWAVAGQTAEERLRKEHRLMTETGEVKTHAFADVETANVSAAADVVEEHADLEYDPTGDVTDRDDKNRMSQSVHGSVVGEDKNVDTASSSCDVVAVEIDGCMTDSRSAASRRDGHMFFTEDGDPLLALSSSIVAADAGDVSDDLMSLHKTPIMTVQRADDGDDASGSVDDATLQQELQSVSDDDIRKIHCEEDRNVRGIQPGGTDTVRQVEGREEEDAVHVSSSTVVEYDADNPSVQASDSSVDQIRLEISRPSYGISSDNSCQSKVELLESFRPTTSSSSLELSSSGLTKTNGNEDGKDEESLTFSGNRSFSLVPDEKCDGTGDQWETMRRQYYPKGDLDLRDGGSSRAPSEWSAMSEIGSEMDGKMAEVADFDDRSSVASNDEHTGMHKISDDVTGDHVERGTDVDDVERGTSRADFVVGDDAVRNTSSDDDLKEVDKSDVSVQLKRTPKLELKASGSNGKPKDDRLLDSITSPKRSLVYTSFDIDIDEPCLSGTAAEEDRPADSLLSDKTNSAQNTVEKHQMEGTLLSKKTTSNRDVVDRTEDGHLSTETDEMSLLLNSSEHPLEETGSGANAAVDRNLMVLRQSWDDIQVVAGEGDEQNEAAIVELQRRNDDALKSISGWLESIRLKMASQDVVLEQDVDEHVKSAEQRLDDVERSVPTSMPMDEETKRQLRDLRDSLRNVQQQISALEEERALKQQQADERNLWLQNLQDQVHSIEDNLLQCQRDLAESLLVPPSEAVDDMSPQDKENVADLLIEQCRSGHARLIALNSSVDEKHRSDPNIFAPAEMGVLQQHWKALLEKIEKVKVDIAKQATANEQFENSLDEFEKFLKDSSESFEATSHPTVADAATLEEHVDVDRGLLESLSSKSATLDAVAAVADTGTREKLRLRTANLHDCTNSLKDKLSSHVGTLSSQAVIWHEFERRTLEQSRRLDSIADQLSADVADKNSAEALLQKLDDCNALLDELTDHRQDVFEVIATGRQILQHVDCPGIMNQIKDLELQYYSLVDKATSQNEPLRAAVQQLDSFKSDMETLEAFLSRVRPQMDQMKDLIAGDRLEADVISKTSDILQILRSGCSEQQPCKTRLLSCRHDLQHVLLDDDPAYERLQLVEDQWRHLLEEIANAEQRLSDAQLALMPSTQAAEELLLFLNGVDETLKSDDQLRPSNTEEVQNLFAKHAVIKGEISNRQRIIPYLAECIHSLTADETVPRSTNVVALVKRLEDVTERYRALADDVGDRCDVLIVLLPQWKKYGDDIGTLNDWLVQRKAAVHELKASGFDEEEDVCQMLESELEVKKTELEKLVLLSDDLSKSQHWPSEAGSVATTLKDLRERLSAVESSWSTLKTMIDSRQQLVASFELAFSEVKKTLAHFEASLKEIDESGDGDLPMHSSKVARVKELQSLFGDAGRDLNEVSECLQSLSRTSSEVAVQPYRDRYQEIFDSWHNQQLVLEDSVSKLTTLQEEWTKYNAVYENMLSQVDEYRKELNALSDDCIPESRHHNLARAEALLSNLNNVQGASAELPTISSQFADQLSALASAKIACDLKTLNEEVADLRSEVDRLCVLIRMDRDTKSKCDAEYERLIELFGDVSLASDLRKSVDVVDGIQLEQSLVSVEESLKNMQMLKPTLTELNSVQLDKQHADRMQRINIEWEERLRQLEAIRVAIEQRQEKLISFKNNCKRWLELLSSVEADLANQTVTSYWTLNEELSKWEKFSSTKSFLQQQLNALIGEGSDILVDAADTEMGTKHFQERLSSLEHQWKSVSNQSEERRNRIGDLMSAWQSYTELVKKLSDALDELRQFIDQHSVSDCAVDDLQSLLEKYKAARKQLSDSQPQYDQLALLVSQLQSSDICVLETEEDPAACIQAIAARRHHLSSELEQLIEKLELSVKLLEDARIEIDDMVAAQVVIKQSVVRELPVRQEDLTKELAELKALSVELSSEEKTATVMEKLHQASHTSGSSPSSSESSTLSRRLELFNDQRAETIDRVLGRQKEISDKLRRWSDFDAQYEQLMEQLRSMKTKITEVKSPGIEDAIANLQNELLPKMEFIGSQKDQLLSTGQELSTVSDETHAQDIGRKGKLLTTMWTDQQHILKNRLAKLTESLNAVDQFEVQMKNLRQWLIETKDRLTHPIVFLIFDDGEIRRHYKEQMALQADIEAHSVAISSLLNLSESLISDKMACPTDVERQPIKMAVQELDDMWPAIKSACVARRKFLEETDELWRQFDRDVISLRKKLSSLGDRISRFKTDGETFSDIKDMIGRLKDIKKSDFPKLSADLSRINTSYTKLVQKHRIDQSGVFQKMVDGVNESWSELDLSAATAMRDLQEVISMKETFETDLQSARAWLTSLERALSDAETFSSIRLKSVLLSVQSDLDKNAGQINDLDRCMEALLQKCHRSDSKKIRHSVEGVHRLHAQVLAHLRELALSTSVSSVADDSTDMSELEKDLETSMTQITTQLEHAVLLVEAPGDDFTGQSYSKREFEVKKADSHLPSDLIGLEEWLTATESSVKRLSKSKPSSRAKSALRTLQRDIVNWEPRVRIIRSSTSNVSQQTLETESLCERISSANERWIIVCQLVDELCNRMKRRRGEASVLTVNKGTSSPRHLAQTGRSLEELEQWLSAAEGSLQSQSLNLRDLADCELLLSQLRLISDDITDWKPHVTEIRSSSHAYPSLDADKELMCNRISSAMELWTSICDVVPKRIATVACFLMADDSFRLGVDDLLGRVVDIRQELRVIEADHLRPNRTVHDDRQLLKHLTEIWLELRELQMQANKFHSLATCLVHSKRPDVGQKQLEQIAAADDEVQLLQQTCTDLVASLGGGTDDETVLSEGSGQAKYSSDRLSAWIPSPANYGNGNNDNLQPEAEEELEVILQPLLRTSVDGSESPTSDPVEPGTASRYEGRGNVLSRACLIAMPVQVLGFLLLGVAALVPLCDEDCARSANTFLYSLQPMLRYYDGLPPL